MTLVGDAADRVATLLADRRMVTGNSSCGVCGRRTIDDLMSRTCTVDGAWRIPSRVVRALPDRLRAAQSVLEETGGLHAAGLFDLDGTLVAIAEDVSAAITPWTKSLEASCSWSGCRSRSAS